MAGEFVSVTLTQNQAAAQITNTIAVANHKITSAETCVSQSSEIRASRGNTESCQAPDPRGCGGGDEGCGQYGVHHGWGSLCTGTVQVKTCSASTKSIFI